MIEQKQNTMRVLVVGAGIAGLSFAGLLKRQGFTSIKIIEKQTVENFNSTGYMIGLVPAGGQILNMLGLHDSYVKNSLAVNEYGMYGADGKRLNHFSLDVISKYGTYQSISRPRLIDLLLLACNTPVYGTTVTAIKQQDEESEVTFSDGTKEIYDLVVVADGIHSITRDIVFGAKNRTYRQTGWAGWAWFGETPAALGTTYREYWGINSFVGLYPVEDNKVGIFLGGKKGDIQKAGHATVAVQAARELKSTDFDFASLLEPLKGDSDPFFWDFHDCRTKEWVKGNVVLLGDAADGFMPTAGIGAAMAMDSASALADQIARGDPGHVNVALQLYEKRQKKRVIDAQNTSRTLGNLMFVKNPAMAWLRNQIARVVSVDSFLNNIKKMVER